MLKKITMHLTIFPLFREKYKLRIESWSKQQINGRFEKSTIC